MSKQEKILAVKGMNDILTADAPLWELFENTAESILKSYGYQKIVTPILEETGLFARAIGAVTDIDTFSAAIHAVFDQHRRNDARFIPFEIGDVKDRSVNPLLVALEWLLRLPQQRCRQSEVRDLLDVPAVAARFGLAVDDLPTLGRWIDGAGVRWGLDQSHHAGLGLGSAGEQNAWIFGVRRMLLGYASGLGANFRDIEPYAEVGGLDAALAGSLAQLVEALLHWRAALAVERTPAEWGEQARALLAACCCGAGRDCCCCCGAGR